MKFQDSLPKEARDLISKTIARKRMQDRYLAQVNFTRTCHNLTRTCHNLTRTWHNLTRTCHKLIRTCHVTRTGTTLPEPCHNFTRTCHNLTRTCHNLIRTCHVTRTGTTLPEPCHNFTRTLSQLYPNLLQLYPDQGTIRRGFSCGPDAVARRWGPTSTRTCTPDLSQL